jgi:uncharacterized protein (DUF488 family)
MASSRTPILFDRQKRLLGLLHALGGNVGNLDFQKLLLLYCTEQGEERSYEFVPYKYGAFSFTSYADRRKLVERGLLAADDRHWELTAAGRQQASRLHNGVKTQHEFALRHRGLRGDTLVAHTYRQLPYYAIRSEIAARVLGGDDEAFDRIEEARPKRARAGISTIGYEGRTLEAFLNVLLSAGVTLLCDVRRNPISRKYGFSKGTLSKSSAGVGIEYVHIPELGIASDKRQNLNTQADYDALFEVYVSSTLPFQSEALARIRDWVAHGQCVALMCYEGTATQCHRNCVSDVLARNFGQAFVPTHL